MFHCFRFSVRPGIARVVTAQTKGKHFSTHDNSVKQLRRVESFVVDGSWGVYEGGVQLRWSVIVKILDFTRKAADSNKSPKCFGKFPKIIGDIRIAARLHVIVYKLD